jgi:hypothetical protein
VQAQGTAAPSTRRRVGAAAPSARPRGVARAGDAAAGGPVAEEWRLRRRGHAVLHVQGDATAGGAAASELASSEQEASLAAGWHC